MKSRVILTAAELDLFTKLDKDSITARDLAARLDLNERATTRILDCLIAFGLLEKQNDCYRTTETGSYLSSIHPQSVRHSSRSAQINFSHMHPHSYLLCRVKGCKSLCAIKLVL